MMPLFGRTQYLRGAVVLTLKQTFLSVGLVSFRVAVTTSVKGPAEWTKEKGQSGDLGVCESASVYSQSHQSLNVFLLLRKTASKQ